MLRENPQAVSARVNLGNLLGVQGEVAAARAHLEEALRLDPSFEPAKAALARLGAPARPVR